MLKFNNGIIRAHTHLYATIIEEDENNPNHIKQIILNHTDLKGNLPSFFVNLIFPWVNKNFSKNFSNAYRYFN